MVSALATKRVQRGAALLDRVLSGWEKLMPMPEEIDMAKGGACILGHAFSDYAIGRQILFDKACCALDGGEAQSIRHGFNITFDPQMNPVDSVTYNELFEAWSMEIEHRLWFAIQKQRPGPGAEKPIQDAPVALEPALV